MDKDIIKVNKVEQYQFKDLNEQFEAMKNNQIILTDDFYANMFKSYGLDIDDEFVKNNIIHAPMTKWYALLTDFSVDEKIRNAIKNIFNDINSKMSLIKKQNPEMYAWLFKRLGKDFGIKITDEMIKNFEQGVKVDYYQYVTN